SKSPEGTVEEGNGGARRRRARQLRCTRGAARRRSQERQRGDVAGVRPAGIPGRYAHPPLGGALGTVEWQLGGAHRTRSQTHLSTRDVEQAASADHLLRPPILSGARSRPDALPDLLLGGVEGAHQGRKPPSATRRACYTTPAPGGGASSLRCCVQLSTCTGHGGGAMISVSGGFSPRRNPFAG